VLLVAAGLMIQSLWHLNHVNLGFNPRNVLAMDIWLDSKDFKQAALIEASFFPQALDRVRSTPGVLAATCSASIPLRGPDYWGRVQIAQNGSSPITAFTSFRSIDKDFFRTLEIPILSGRGFTDEDNSSSPKVVIANEAFARKYFPNHSPIGTYIGIYGVISYAVEQRTHEIGVRLALGAQSRTVVQMIIREGLRYVLAGIAIGIVSARWLTQLMTNQLYEVEPHDWLTFMVIPVLLVLVALSACMIPAQRVARMNPMMALRNE
jgi:ABC-type antimicrobial peptide transport system permease subunit